MILHLAPSYVCGHMLTKGNINCYVQLLLSCFFLYSYIHKYIYTNTYNLKVLYATPV